MEESLHPNLRHTLGEGELTSPDPILARCRTLGHCAVMFDMAGELVGCEAPSSQLRELLATEVLVAPLRARLITSQLAQPAELVPGVWIAPIRYVPSSGSALTGAVVFFSPRACEDHTVLASAGVLGMGPEATKALLAPVALADDATARALAEGVGRALALAVQDLVQLSDREQTESAYTSHLSLAFDTIDLLYTVSKAISSPHAPEKFLNQLCAKAYKTLNFRWLCVAFSHDDTVPRSIAGCTYTQGELPLPADSMRERLLAASVAVLPGPHIHEDIVGCATEDQPQVLLQNLECRGKAVGVLAIGGKQGIDPIVSSYDSQLMEACAGFVSAFIESVKLYQDQHDLFVGTVQTLTAAIDAKDRYTCGHSERVAQIAWQLAVAGGLPRDDADRVRVAGLVHDVGKIGVPEAILTKPGKLLDHEFDSIKRHPDIGYNVLRPVRQLADVLPAVLHHHERYDGKGYPQRLAGEAIPLWARIIAVADTFDAMSSDRSYRQKLPREKVLEEIARSAGTQLDPTFARLMTTLDLTEYDAMSARHKQLELPLAPPALAA